MKDFNLFEFLNALDSHKRGAFNELSEHTKKDAQPFILQRWLYGNASDLQIIKLNEFSNKYVFSLQNEKALLCELLSICGSGSPRKNKWIPFTKNKNIKNILDVIKSTYNCSTREAEQYIQVLNEDDIIELAENLGVDKSVLQKLKKEFGDNIGTRKS